jgi:hypothetical protein
MYAALHRLCDVAIARSAATRNTAGHPQLVLATTILASSLAFIDGSVVNPGSPRSGTVSLPMPRDYSGSSTPTSFR